MNKTTEIMYGEMLLLPFFLGTYLIFPWFYGLAIGIATAETCLFQINDQILLEILWVFRARAMRYKNGNKNKTHWNKQKYLPMYLPIDRMAVVLNYFSVVVGVFVVATAAIVVFYDV